MAKAKKAIPEGFHTVTPHLITRECCAGHRLVQEGARRRKKWREPSVPTAKSCTRSCASAIRIIMLNDAMMGGKGPRSTGRLTGVALGLCGRLPTRCSTALSQRAGKSPAGPMGNMADQFWGDRCGTLQRSAGLYLDDRDTQGRSDSAGNRTAAGRLLQAARAQLTGSESPPRRLEPARRTRQSDVHCFGCAVGGSRPFNRR